MKKFFTLVAMATMALAANAQNAVYTELGYASIPGINADATVDVAGGTALGTDAAGNVFSTAFADQCKLVGVTASGYTTIVVNGAENSISGGYQGNNNAKDADGGNSAATLKPAATGSVLVVEAAADGYMYVVGKFSNNKQYVVFEDGSPIGYTCVIDGTAAGTVDAVAATVVGDDADQYFVTTPIDKLGAINGLGDGTANNGAGFIKFQCWAGSTYYVHATGSKLTQCGTIFSETGEEDIILKGEKEGVALTDIVLESAGSAVAGVAEAAQAAVKAVKVAADGQITIGNANIAGQIVK